MKNILLIVIMFTLLTLLGCNGKSLEDQCNKKTYENDLATLVQEKLLSEEDNALLTSYIVSHESDSLALSKSYAEILSTAKKEYEERAEKRKTLDESMTVKVTRKYTQNFYDEGYLKNFLLVDIIAQNNTNKQVSGFTVRINFKSADSLVFYTSDWPIAQVVKANSSTTIQLSTGEFLNTNVEQSKLKMADLSKIKIEYEILQLIYDDGTSLSLY